MSKFKVGDRVTLKKAVDVHIDGGLTQIVPGEIGRIDWTDGNEMEVYFDDYVKLDLYASQVKLIEPTDCKAAFLEELRALLDKYDASIYAHPIHEWEDVLLQMDICIGCDVVCQIKPCCDLSAETIDNIMSYDKEGVGQKRRAKSRMTLPIVGELEPVEYNPNESFDWSVKVDLSRCTATQLRFLSENCFAVGDEIIRRIKQRQIELEQQLEQKKI